jgi:hypothetical protein
MINPCIIIAMLLALIASGLGGYSFGYDVAADEYKAEILRLQNDANLRLAEKTREALEATEKQIQTAQQLEIEHHEANQKINQALADNRALRLRYKSAAPRCAPVPEAGSPGGADDEPKIVEFELPRAITDDLFGLAASADRVSNYADTCYRWVRSLAGDDTATIL